MRRSKQTIRGSLGYGLVPLCEIEMICDREFMRLPSVTPPSESASQERQHRENKENHEEDLRHSHEGTCIIPPKPSNAAIKAMTRQVIANCNMVKLS